MQVTLKNCHSFGGFFFFAFGVRGLWVRLLHREIAQKCVICALGLRAWVKFGYNTKAAVAAEAANKVSLLRPLRLGR